MKRKLEWKKYRLLLFTININNTGERQYARQKTSKTSEVGEAKTFAGKEEESGKGFNHGNR